MNDRFLRACRREPVDRTPVWFMRQAGRYMAEYRALRQRYTLLEIVAQPDLAVAVTLQPVDAIEVDAAILFSDLLLPFTPMGLDFDFVKGEGPSIEHPIRSAADVDRLRDLRAARGARRTCSRRSACCAASWRVACRSSGSAARRSRWLHMRSKAGRRPTTRARRRSCTRSRRPGTSSATAFATVMVDYLKAQVEAGVQALQMFDSWAGALGRHDYREFAMPHTARIFDELRDVGRPGHPLRRRHHRNPARISRRPAAT